MIDQLDNPVWSALNSGNRNLALGNEKARFFQPGISPFVAVAQHNPEHYQVLMQTIAGNETVAVFTTEKNLDPAPWTVVNRIDGYQMMYEADIPKVPNGLQIVKLTGRNVPAMLELTQLSPPGPFLEDTIRFGGYEGIFVGETLVAMAGYRFHSGPYVEISAVCTHPGHTGKGYARNLIFSRISQIRAEGNVPYLHVRADNARAYQLYLDMGFITRTDMTIYLLRKQVE